MANRIRQKPIELHFESTEQVLVVPDDKDRFVTTMGEAARACQQAENSREWDQQWKDMLYHVHEWCKAHEDSVAEGYVCVGDSAINIIVCVRGEDYDFSFEDELSEFDLELAQKFPLCKTEVMQIPNQRDMKAGLSSRSMKVYGDGQRASATSRP
jgi:hypothetical protein